MAVAAVVACVIGFPNVVPWFAQCATVDGNDSKVVYAEVSEILRRLYVLVLQ